MGTPLSVLIVEDSASDAGLMLRQLQLAGFDLLHERVDGAAEMRVALERRAWDVVLSDFGLPGFDAGEALALLQKTGLDIPFIIVSGAIGEEIAVELMKAGAHDYVMKNRLARLAPAVKREIKEAQIRLEARRAIEALRDSEQELRELYSAMHTVREEERRYFARELHDELGQMLTALRIDLNWLEAKLPPVGPDIVAKLAAINGLVNQTVDSVRRISEDLRPDMLDNLGLAAAIENLVNKFTERTGISCDLSMSSDDFEVDSRTSIVIFRSAQESLTNVARHAAASQISIQLQEDAEEVRLVVQDNGRGLPQAPAERSSGRKGYGLLGMRERVAMMDGRISIDSAQSEGVRIEIGLPKSVDRESRRSND